MQQQNQAQQKRDSRLSADKIRPILLLRNECCCCRWLDLTHTSTAGWLTCSLSPHSLPFPSPCYAPHSSRTPSPSPAQKHTHTLHTPTLHIPTHQRSIQYTHVVYPHIHYTQHCNPRIRIHSPPRLGSSSQPTFFNTPITSLPLTPPYTTNIVVTLQ